MRLQLSRHRHHRPGQAAGFSMVEVLVALLVTSIGLLGLAGMQALAVANAQTARTRSIAALQASSLAAAMHGNRTFWTFGSAPAGFSTNGATITDVSGTLRSQPVVQCFVAGACTPLQLANFDVQTWTNSINQLLPGAGSSMACSTNTTLAFSCVLTINWTEHYVAGATAQANSTATGGARSYSLYIEP